MRPSSRTEAARRLHNRRTTAIVASALVVVVITVLVVVKIAGGSSSPFASRTAVSPSALSELSAVPMNALLAAARGAAAQSGTVHPPINLPSGVPALQSGGKPEVFYVGAEFCPYCAGERWPLVLALSKFGTFSGLVTTESSSTDVNPKTPTFSFAGSSYTSPYIAFVSLETADRSGRMLQTPTGAEAVLIQTYDAPPFVSGSSGSIPFIDIGGRYLVSGTQYDASALAGKSFDTALADIVSDANPTSKAAEAVAANLIGTICSLTNDQPSAVCSAIPASLKTGQAAGGNQGSSAGG
jgi:hypothetical protein